MSRAAAERHGRKGEGFASLRLRLRGWRILAQRVKVKWRSTAAERDLAIDAYRLRRVAAAVEAVAHRFLRDGDNPRIDVLLLAPRAWPRHIVNAWQP